MPSFSLRKQTFLILVLCILGVLATAAYAGKIRNPQKTPSVQNTAQNMLQAGRARDALATTTDWQKQFFTASNTPTAFSSAISPSTKPSDEPETITGQFGKIFFEKYLVLKQNDLVEDPEAIQAVIDQSMENLVSGAPQAQVYDERVIKLTAGNDLAAERAYGNAIGSVIQINMPAEDAATIASRALEEGDSSAIAKVRSVADSYSRMLAAALQTPVPQNLSGLHINLINSISGMVFVSTGMERVFTDPIQSIVALASYAKSLRAFQSALLDLKYNFSVKQVQFSDSESGTVFGLIQ